MRPHVSRKRCELTTTTAGSEPRQYQDTNRWNERTHRLPFLLTDILQQVWTDGRYFDLPAFGLISVTVAVTQVVHVGYMTRSSAHLPSLE